MPNINCVFAMYFIEGLAISFFNKKHDAHMKFLVVITSLTFINKTTTADILRTLAIVPEIEG
jgi:hypothetical protein